MLNSWLVLTPPLLVTLLAFFTQKLTYSLLMGIILAAFLATSFSPVGTLSLLSVRSYEQVVDIDNLFLYGFLFSLGILIALLEYSGAAQAFAAHMIKKIKSSQKVQLASLTLSTFLFLDDYLSCLTVGYVIRPLADFYRIARVKLAYLIHSFSGPIVIIAPLSSWIALITNQIEKAGINPNASATTVIIADPLYIYYRCIPYIFYSFILIASVLFIVVKKISFGPMHEQEEIAQATGNLWGGKQPLTPTTSSISQSASLWELIIPITILISSFIIGILWSGQSWLVGGQRSLVDALKHTSHISVILCAASSIALISTVLLFCYKKIITRSLLEKCTKDGIMLMSSSVCIVFLASLLAVLMRDDLGSGLYLAHVLEKAISITWLPLMFFILSLGIALMTGSAWGTIALLVPLAVQTVTSFSGSALPLALSAVPALMPVLGAVFSGAVGGNHISPIAETTIMSATSSGCYPLDHAITQLWYVLPVIGATALAYAIAGFHVSSLAGSLLVPLLVGSVVCLAIILMANKLRRS